MSTSPSSSPEKTIVLVDDEVAYVDLLVQLLGDYFSCPVRGFSKPSEALAALPTMNVGLLITDFEMPEMNGVAFIQTLQTLNPDIPVLMITGHSLNLTDREKQAMPALRGSVGKPFKWRALADEVAKHWSGPALAPVANSAPATRHL
jgi:DNA-binding NtrC family response regulator